MALSSVVGGFRLKIKGRREHPITDINHHFSVAPTSGVLTVSMATEALGLSVNKSTTCFVIKKLFGVCQESQTK